MPSTHDLLNSIQAAATGLTLAEVLAEHPDIARRTAQRAIAKLIEHGQVAAQGEGRARRYLAAGSQIDTDTIANSFAGFPASTHPKDRAGGGARLAGWLRYAANPGVQDQ